MVVRADTAVGELYLIQPYAMPDGKTALMGVQPTGGLGGTQLASVSLETGELTRFDLAMLDPLGYSDGTRVYVTPSGAMMAVGIDPGEGRITSDPIALGPTVLIRVTGSSDAALSVLWA